MSRRVVSSLFAGAVLAVGLFGAGEAGAQDRLVLRPVPHAVEPWLDDAAAVLIPPAVPGAAFGYSGYGYYYDGPGEGPLLREPAVRRTSAGRGWR